MKSIKHETREQWLVNAAELMAASLFTEEDMPDFRVSCSFPDGSKNKILGQCFDPSASADKTVEIIVTIMRDSRVEVLATLAHELIHAALGTKEGHGKNFRRVALRIGLTGKMTATVAGEDFKKWVWKNRHAMGLYPHKRIIGGALKKQTTRMVKAECPECGYITRTSRKWINDIGAPHCPLHGEMQLA